VGGTRLETQGEMRLLCQPASRPASQPGQTRPGEKGSSSSECLGMHGQDMVHQAGVDWWSRAYIYSVWIHGAVMVVVVQLLSYICTVR